MRNHLRHHRVFIPVLVLFLTVGISDMAFATVFFCSAGDVGCLIESIERANKRRGADIIILQAGTYTLTAINNTADAGENVPTGNGLPSITGRLTIEGAGPDETIIQGLSGFRIVHVAAPGHLTLRGVTIRAGSAEEGGGIFNRGRLTISDSVIRDNASAAFIGNGGGIRNLGTLKIIDSSIIENVAPGALVGGIASSGSLEILRSTVARNTGGFFGGIDASGTTQIRDSTISDNIAVEIGPAGLAVDGTTTIVNTTIAHNLAFAPGGGGIQTGGTLYLTNVTIADNFSEADIPSGAAGSGIFAFGGGSVVMQNSVVARNTAATLLLGTVASDCFGSVTSLGNNIIGDTAGCTIDLAPTDFVGSAGLGVFEDDGIPGHGHIPLLAESPAIDAANRAACPRRDQLGNRRVDGDGDGHRFCDIGAVEFIP